MTTNSFTIAKYILLVLVCGVVFMYGIWLITSPRRGISRTEQCRESVVETVNNIWNDNPTEIPPQYIQMVVDYTDFVIQIPTSGRCRGTEFTCAPGMRRRDCNPCAAEIGAERARDQYISDMQQQMCGRK